MDLLKLSVVLIQFQEELFIFIFHFFPPSHAISVKQTKKKEKGFFLKNGTAIVWPLWYADAVDNIKFDPLKKNKKSKKQSNNKNTNYYTWVLILNPRSNRETSLDNKNPFLYFLVWRFYSIILCTNYTEKGKRYRTVKRTESISFVNHLHNFPF